LLGLNKAAHILLEFALFVHPHNLQSLLFLISFDFFIFLSILSNFLFCFFLSLDHLRDFFLSFLVILTLREDVNLTDLLLEGKGEAFLAGLLIVADSLCNLSLLP
jgi:hypothetical protein